MFTEREVVNTKINNELTAPLVKEVDNLIKFETSEKLSGLSARA